MANLDYTQLLAQLQQSQAAANAANAQRYQAGLSELTGARNSARSSYDQALASLGQIGQSATEDASRGAARAYATGQQQLISSGLANTTIAANLPRGIEEDRDRAMRAINEQRAQQSIGLATQRAGMELGASGQLANFIGARSDQGPDLGLYAGLLSAAAAAPDASQGRTTISGGLGPMASAGLTGTGQPFRYGGGGGGSGGGSFGGGGGLSAGGGGGGSQGAPGTTTGAIGGGFQGVYDNPSGQSVVADVPGATAMKAREETFQQYKARQRAAGSAGMSAMYWQQVLGRPLS